MARHDSWDNLINFIQDHKLNWKEVLAQEPYYVSVKKAPFNPDLYMFSYNPTMSDFGDPIVRCCRGSVFLVNEQEIKPVIRPFFKFTNSHENHTDPIDWSTDVRCRVKVDGSLCKWLAGEDLWTLNNTFDIETVIPLDMSIARVDPFPINGVQTYKALIDYCKQGHEDELGRIPRDWVLLFELTSPYAPIVVKYPNTKLWLLGGRDSDGYEINPEELADRFGLTFDIPKSYPFNSIQEVVKACEKMSGDKQEGFVIQDGWFNRVKVKCESYMGLTHIKNKDALFAPELFKLIRDNKMDDANLPPETQISIKEISAEWNKFLMAVHGRIVAGTKYYVEECKAPHKAYPEEGGEPTITEKTPREVQKQYAEWIFKHPEIKPFGTFLFEAVKETPRFERLYQDIDYKELKEKWLPLVDMYPKLLTI